MPTYTYKARDRQGELMTGEIDGANDLAVAANLRSLGYNVVSIEQKAEKKAGAFDFLQRLKKAHKDEFIFFSQQLSSLIRSGIPITQAIESIAEQARNKVFKEALKTVLKDIEGGASFSTALAKHPGVFSDLFVSMARVGETGGILDEVMERIAQLGAQERDVRTRITSAMTYPIILVIVAVTVVSFLLVNIIPKFVTIFETYNARLPLPTQVLLAVSFFMRRLWYVILLVIAVALLWFKGYVSTEKGKYRFHFYLLHLPLFGQLYLKLIISRFSRTLGVLVKSGVPILEALDVTKKTVGNLVIRRVLENIRYAVVEGHPLTEPFKASGVFPPMVIQMVSFGEKSGKLDQLLIDVASYYDQEVEYAIKNITTALEPLLLLAMGLMVAFIALSVLLPIFNLIKVFKH